MRQAPTEEEPLEDEELTDDLPGLIRELVSQVPAASLTARRSEAKIVGGCFRVTASALRTGTIQANADPYIDVQRQAQLALGNSYKNWSGFFSEFSPHTAADSSMERALLYAGIAHQLSTFR
jgi:hypothetical protein